MLNILVQYDNNGDNQVTSGARGIAYSCLLDCLCAGNEHRKGWEALQVTHVQDGNCFGAVISFPVLLFLLQSAWNALYRVLCRRL